MPVLVVRDGGVEVTSIDMETNPVRSELILQLHQGLTGGPVHVRVRLSALRKLLKVLDVRAELIHLVAVQRLPLRLHPVQLQEQIFLSYFRPPPVEWKLGPVSSGKPHLLPLIRQPILVSVFRRGLRLDEDVRGNRRRPLNW